jgi:hypothetical protein
VSTEPSSRLGKVVACLGIAQITLLLASSVYRLTPKALEPWQDGSLSSLQKALFFGWIVLNAYLEGYRGFQQRFCPRVVARAKLLSERPSLARALLSLPYCLSLYDAPRREMIPRVIFLAALVTLIVAVKQLPQPWLGIIDGGVVVGLAWGMVMTLVYFVRFLQSGEVPAVVVRARPAAA